MKDDTESEQESNQPRQAVALEYDGKNAPTVSATAEGALAQQIIDLAIEHEVPMFENPVLVELLAELELGSEIPEELYHCIAHIIAFAYRIQDQTA